MSYTSLIIFKGGKAAQQVGFRNAWGGSARIWDALFTAYVPKRGPYDSWLTGDGDDKRLWNLVDSKELTDFERAVHAFTFDLFYVRNEHLGNLEADLRAFVVKYRRPGKVNHLPAWAQWIEGNPTVEAVGLYGSSVGENLWYRNKSCPHCGHAIDETEPVPLTDGIEVYDWLVSRDRPFCSGRLSGA